MKKIPPGAEACNVLVGELDFLKKPVIAFVRLENALLLNNMTEVPIQTRFLFFMLGPPSAPGRYHEVGRAMATMMTDEVHVKGCVYTKIYGACTLRSHSSII